MNKKISILTLTFLFFASTSGLPLVLHYCEMMGSVSFEVCEMHNVEPVSESCCETGNESELFFTSGYDQCCSNKLVDASVKDHFVISKTETIKGLTADFFFILNFDLSRITSDNLYTDTSPPPLIDNRLYLSNSILLI